MPTEIDKKKILTTSWVMNFADTVATSRHFILSLVMQQWFLSISLPNTIYSQDSTHAVHACNWMYFLKTIAKKKYVFFRSRSHQEISGWWITSQPFNELVRISNHSLSSFSLDHLWFITSFLVAPEQCKIKL